MSEEPKPKEKQTVVLPSVPPWAVEMTRSMKNGFTTTNTNIGLVASELSLLKERVGAIESWRSEMDSRASRASARAQEISRSDLAQEAKIADAIAKSHELERKISETHALASNAATRADIAAVEAKIDTASIAQTQAIIEGVRAAAQNPMVRKIGYAAGALVLQILALGTAYLAMRGHE